MDPPIQRGLLGQTQNLQNPQDEEPTFRKCPTLGGLPGAETTESVGAGGLRAQVRETLRPFYGRDQGMASFHITSNLTALVFPLDVRS
jgi:hypothetical protein